MDSILKDCPLGLDDSDMVLAVVRERDAVLAAASRPQGDATLTYPQSFCHQRGHWAETKVNEKTYGAETSYDHSQHQ